MSLYSLRKAYWWVFGIVKSLFSSRQFGIRKGYHHRNTVIPYDDTNSEDEWQDEVYSEARNLFDSKGYRTVIDFGCGSGYKLMKYFKEDETLGFEIEPTLSFLKEKYENRNWERFDPNKKYSCDLLILSDVIEHILDPKEIIEEIIESIEFKDILISTPDRSLLQNAMAYGPPRNPSHYREWNFQEFGRFISEFLIVKKHFISNEEQATQLVLGKPKTVRFNP